MTAIAFALTLVIASVLADTLVNSVRQAPQPAPVRQRNQRIRSSRLKGH